MKKIIRSLALLSLISTPLLAGKVDMRVRLSPTGSFTITGTSLSGKVVRKGDSIFAESIVLDLRNLKSGIELRDKHVQEYFETDKFPQAVLLEALGTSSSFRGKLKLRGIVKDIQGNFEDTGASGKAFFKVKMSDFNIKNASYMGLGVKDEIEVIVDGPIPTT